MRRIYMDHMAATPIHPEVLEAMLPYLKEDFGNPLSLHYFGGAPKRALDEAREKVALLIGADPKEIIFVSSGTEANNLAIKGVAYAHQKKGKHIISSQIEHHSVVHSLKSLEKAGFKVTYLPVDKYGLVDPNAVAEAITNETILVTIVHGNSEIGTIGPLAEISRITREKGVYLHTDAVATTGRINIDVGELGVDALSLAASQFYGPKGAAALYLKKGVRIQPLIDGGIQEEGKRAGIEDVPAIVGMGRAAEIAKRELPSRMGHLNGLRGMLIDGLLKGINRVYLTGHPERRLPGHVSICVEYIEGESMLLFLNQKGIAASSGSTCTSRALKASHVLLAIGVDPAITQGSLVFSLGKDNTKEDVDYILEVLPPIVQRLREMSPLYEDAMRRSV